MPPRAAARIHRAIALLIRSRYLVVDAPLRSAWHTGSVTVLRIAILFILAAIAEIGGAWLIWQAVKEDRGWLFAVLGVMALGAYGFVAALQPDANFGRVLAAYGGIFIAGSLAWGIIVDGFRPTLWDWVGSTVALVGAAIIILAPALTADTAEIVG